MKVNNCKKCDSDKIQLNVIMGGDFEYIADAEMKCLKCDYKVKDQQSVNPAIDSFTDPVVIAETNVLEKWNES